MAGPWRVHHTTTPAFLDTPPSLVQSSTTTKRNSIIPAAAICFIVSSSIHSLATLQHTLLHTPLPRPNVTAVAISKVFTSYLQQLALLHTAMDGMPYQLSSTLRCKSSLFGWAAMEDNEQERIDQQLDGEGSISAAIAWLSSTNMMDLMDACNQVQ
ncbi:predicted protein [Lichtheimia corymbifera JMRC:FSU:9682]|uniref:Uncharacterized protein n=1 Tax=Lichtheimia corymbifera JMRC:FSU:9682 TaxID=1263082 RepID=A0A068S6H5_9FUNG|nr:predicted protein [Lichtheimia corymbifera JMRC:FSU:9682]